MGHCATDLTYTQGPHGIGVRIGECPPSEGLLSHIHGHTSVQQHRIEAWNDCL